MSMKLIRVAALAAAAVATTMLLPAAAHAATSYRQFRTIHSGYCLRPYSSFLDVRANSCNISPTRNRDWMIIKRGNLNGHALWQIENRGNGHCLGRGGDDLSNGGYIEHTSCSQASDQIFEVFPDGGGVITLGSYGAWTQRGLHLCLMYLGGTGELNTDLRGCNTANINQRWR
jgi:hypothetical protein